MTFACFDWMQSPHFLRIPAAVLADLLGLSAKTTARVSAELKVDYAGYVARRTPA